MGQKFREILKMTAAQKDKKSTLQWIRLKLHWLKVQNDPWKVFFFVTWWIIHTKTINFCLKSSEPWPPKNFSIEWKPKIVKLLDFLYNLYSKPLQEVRTPKIKVGDRVRVPNYD